MKSFVKIILISSAFLLTQLKSCGQTYSTYEGDLIINNINIGFSPESDITQILGSPTKIDVEPDFLDDGLIKKYYYNNSYFLCRKEKVAAFLIKDNSYILDNLIQVGLEASIIQNLYPKSFSNRINDMSEIENELFDCDSKIWIWLGPEDNGGDGICIYLKNDIIIGYRYISSI